MPVDLSALRAITSQPTFVGVLVKAEKRVIDTDPNRPPREVVTVEVWDENGARHVDNISTSTQSQKRRVWAARIDNVLSAEGGDPSALTKPRNWYWESGGHGQYTFTVLLPGEPVEPPQCDEDDLAFLAIIADIAAGATPEQPFLFSSSFGDDLARPFPRFAVYRNSANWIRALCVRGVIVAEPGDSPDEIRILEVYG